MSPAAILRPWNLVVAAAIVVFSGPLAVIAVCTSLLSAVVLSLVGSAIFLHALLSSLYRLLLERPIFASTVASATLSSSCSPVTGGVRSRNGSVSSNNSVLQPQTTTTTRGRVSFGRQNTVSSSSRNSSASSSSGSTAGTSVGSSSGGNTAPSRQPRRHSLAPAFGSMLDGYYGDLDDFDDGDDDVGHWCGSLSPKLGYQQQQQQQQQQRHLAGMPSPVASNSSRRRASIAGIPTVVRSGSSPLTAPGYHSGTPTPWGRTRQQSEWGLL